METEKLNYFSLMKAENKTKNNGIWSKQKKWNEFSKWKLKQIQVGSKQKKNEINF